MYNDSFTGSLKRGYMRMPVAIRAIITINVVVFFVQALGGQALNNFLVEYLAFYPSLSSTLLQPWRIFTYMFLHAGFFHLLFNMLWLWWMGQSVEANLGPRTFSVIFLGSGIGGALLDVALAQVLGFNYVIGASGAVFGVMVAFAYMYPKMPIMLFLLPPIQARYLVAGLIAIEVLFIGSNDRTARIVHLGGAAIGYLLIKWHYEGMDLSRAVRPFERWYYQLKNRRQRRNPNMHSVSDAEVVEETEESELDEILEKISQSGYENLSEEEKKKLFELSKKNR